LWVRIAWYVLPGRREGGDWGVLRPPRILSSVKKC